MLKLSGRSASLHSRMLTWEQRIAHYKSVMGRDAYLTQEGRWIYGMWLLGQSWQVKSGYYGGYPGNYLRRIAALFPDKCSVLHLFAGKVDLTELPGATLDCRAELSPDFCVNAEDMRAVPLEAFDLIVADPPYSEEDAAHYGVALVNRNKVMQQFDRLPAGCHVVWLDQVLPMYRKDVLVREATIGLSRSTGHRFRVVNIFCRL